MTDDDVSRALSSHNQRTDAIIAWAKANGYGDVDVPLPKKVVREYEKAHQTPASDDDVLNFLNKHKH